MKTFLLNLKKSLLVLFFVGIFTVVGNKAVAQSLIEFFLLLQLLDGPDHLKCYEIDDSFELNGRVDIATPQFGLEPGCKIKEAELFCVPAFKGIPKDKKGTPLPLLTIPSAPVFNDFICYEIECRKPFPPDQEVADQFKKRVISELEPSLLCTPAEKKCSSDAICDDGILCTDDFCDTGTGICQHEPVTCDDGNECTDDSCDPETGECVNTDNTSSCDDGDTCTTGDICSDGECTPGATKNCDDNNDCTNDSCDPASGECSHQNNTNPCVDENACTDNEVCENGTCIVTKKDCDDNDDCTDDSCDPATGCVNENNDSCDPIVGCKDKPFGAPCGLRPNLLCTCDGSGACVGGCI